MKLTIIKGADKNCARPLAVTDYLHPAVVRYLYGENATSVREEVRVSKGKVHSLNKNLGVPELVLPVWYEPKQSSIRFYRSLTDVRRNQRLYIESPGYLIFFCTSQALDQLSVAPDFKNKKASFHGFDVPFSYTHNGILECFVSDSIS